MPRREWERSGSYGLAEEMVRYCCVQVKLRYQQQEEDGELALWRRRSRSSNVCVHHAAARGRGARCLLSTSAASGESGSDGGVQIRMSRFWILDFGFWI